MEYSYKARNTRTNKILRGEAIGENEHEIKQYLVSMEMLPLSVQAKQSLNRPFSLSGAWQSTISLRDIVAFCRQFSVIMEAGISIGRALGLTAKACQNDTLRRKLEQIDEQVTKGGELAKSMEAVGGFPFLLTRMIEVGEATGKLEEVLNQMADYFEHQIEVKKKVKQAMTYPVIILTLLVLAISIIMLKVIPSYMTMFEEMGVMLPMSTQILIGISNGFRRYGLLVGVMGGLGIYLVGVYKRSHRGQYWWDKLMLRLPGLSIINKQLLTARWSEVMVLFIGAGIPIVQAMENSKRVMGNRVVQEELDHMIQDIKQGYPLKEAIQKSEIYPELMISMIGIGEETGTLERMFIKVAQYFNNQVNSIISQLTIIIEPILTIVIAIMIGMMMLAVVTPSFSLATELM